jgi:ABC-2 type transport system permease protein
MKLLDQGSARAALIIRPEFEKSLGAHGSSAVQILIDGSDSASAASVMAYLPLVQHKAQQKIFADARPDRLLIKTRFLFNPELRTQWFMVPGLGVVIIAVLSILLTSLTVAREWESGSMELLLSTPVTPIEIILGKLVPYLLLGLGGAGFVYLIARTVFAVPFQGSHLLYLLGCLLFLACGMLQGILISVVTRAQQVAMQAAMISGLLPSVYLSGFIYPIEHMPGFFQALTLVLPPRWFMKISRDLYLKGSGFAELLSCYGALSIISLVLLLLASRKFKKDLEP